MKRAFTGRHRGRLGYAGGSGVVWDLVKSDYPDRAKKASLLKFDQVLGLGLATYREEKVEISAEARQLLAQREKLRAEKRFAGADEMRRRLAEMGYKVMDKRAFPRKYAGRRVLRVLNW